MKIVMPSANIVKAYESSSFIAKLRMCEYMARKSHMSTEKMTNESWERFLKSVVMNHGDWSVMRHAVVSVEAVVDLGIAAEWRTHKTGHYDGNDVFGGWDECDDIHHGFTQSSTRFVKFTQENPLTVICPDEIPVVTIGYEIWLESVRQTEIAYNALIDKGYPPQIARSVLPRCTAANLGVTYTLHQWRYFFLMRTTAQTHPQFRSITIPLLAEFQSYFPIIFDDIVPNRSQSQNIREPW